MITTFPASGPRQRGFTLVEVTVSLFVTIVVLLGVLALFDFSNRLSRVQTNISDMQQSLRVAQSDMARLVRMAGVGDIPQSGPDGPAVSVVNNVADNRTIDDPSGAAGASADIPEIVPGSDVLTIRGVFSTPVYQIVPNGTSFTLTTPAAPMTGTIAIPSQPAASLTQDLSAIREAVTKGRKEALLLHSVSPSAWAIVELDPGNSNISTDPITVAFKVQGGTNTTAYLALAGGSYPLGLTTVNTVGILEEYRFYVRREYAISGDKTSDLTPKLSRARIYPGTKAPWDGDPLNWKVDVADNIFDLQIALGYDSPANGPGSCSGGKIQADPVNCDIYESADGENDDWMYNGGTTNAASFINSRLYYVRVSTLARTDRRDKDYQSASLVRVEDNTYDTSPFNTRNERMYRHRILRTIIDMRNL
jgi:Tfp pilus assembly protein PilW